MPEGDTIHKLARLMHRDLAGQQIRRLWLRDRGELTDFSGSRVEEVRPLGKHLLIPLSAGHGSFVLHTHLGMKGRWERFGTESTGLRGSAGVELDTTARSFRCRRPMLAELFRREHLLRHPSLSRLGPDLLDFQVSLASVVGRARAREPRTVTDLLLDQRVACGLGNEYRNEILFLRGIHPETRSDVLSDDVVYELFQLGRKLMSWNLGGGKRTTTREVSRELPLQAGESRCFVQNRAGRPCLLCDTEIRASRVGDAARATYWCGTCQPAPFTETALRPAEGVWEASLRRNLILQKKTGRPLQRTPGTLTY